MAVLAKAAAIVTAVPGLGNVQPKVAAGSVTGFLTGVVVWALVSYVPAFHSGVPDAVVALIPVALAWAGHTIAAYLTPAAKSPAKP